VVASNNLPLLPAFPFCQIEAMTSKMIAKHFYAKSLGMDKEEAAK